MRIWWVVLGLAAALLVAGCADRTDYVAHNVEVLDALPIPAGAERLHQASTPYKETELPGAQVAGYGTTRSLTLPPRTSGSAGVAFYRRALRGAWQVVQDGGNFVSFRRGDVWLSVTAFTPGRLELEVDYDCYKGDDSPHCFGP